MVRRRSTVRFRNGAPRELPARPGQKLTGQLSSYAADGSCRRIGRNLGDRVLRARRSWPSQPPRGSAARCSPVAAWMSVATLLAAGGDQGSGELTRLSLVLPAPLRETMRRSRPRSRRHSRRPASGLSEMVIGDKGPLSLIDREWPLPLAFGARSLVPDSVRRLLQIIPAPGGRWPPAVCAAEPVVFREFAVTEEGLECPGAGKAVKQVRAYGVRTVGS